MIEGIDVSHYQGQVHWNLVKKAEIVFAFAKATEGKYYKDPTFSTNWYGMEDADIFHGAYHFFSSEDSGESQAENFLQALNGKSYGSLPPVLDVEVCQIQHGPFIQEVKIWLETVEQALKVQPILYTNPSFWNQVGNGSCSEYTLWIANYQVSQPTLPNDWSQWTFWQYSQSGTINGIDGAVDLDRFNGTLEELQQYSQKHTSPKTQESFQVEEVQPGASLVGIADHYHVSLEALVMANPQIAPEGTLLKIPVKSVSAPSAGKTAETTYTVQPGDTLGGIAQKFGITVDSLVQSNHIANPNLLRVGETLRIPST